MPSTPSPLRYPGGKTKTYKYIKKIIEQNDLIGQTYIEPFAGGSGLALKLLLNDDVKRIVINDFDKAIYSFWYSVLYSNDDFIKLVKKTEVSTNTWNIQKEIFLNPQRYSMIEYGFSAFFLNRTNVSGVLNGGMIGGKSQNGTYKLNARFNKDDLIRKIVSIGQKRDSISLYNMDAIDFLKTELVKYRKVFINFDPPYVQKGSSLYKNSFNEEDHVRLSKEILQCKRKWIVTYDVCELVSKLYNKCRKSYLDINYSLMEKRLAQEYIFFSPKLKLPESISLINSNQHKKEKLIITDENVKQSQGNCIFL